MNDRWRDRGRPAVHVATIGIDARGRGGNLRRRTRPSDSSRRPSRRSHAWRSRTRSACAATSSSRSRSPTRSSSVRRRRRRAGKVVLYLAAHDGAVRGRRAGARPAARPDARRSAAAHRRRRGRPGGALPADGGRDRRARCSIRSRSRCSCCRRASPSPRARSCPPSSTSPDELVRANSRLALIAVLGGDRRGADRGRDPQALGRGVGAALRRSDLRRRHRRRARHPTREAGRAARDARATASCCTCRASSSRVRRWG